MIKKLENLPDIHELRGDPWADEMFGPADRVEPEIKEDMDARLNHLVGTLPAGSLSGGRPMYNSEDTQTWWLSPDPEEREFARDYLGITHETANEGLSVMEKNALYTWGSEMNEAVTGTDVNRAREDKANWDGSMSKLWRAWNAQGYDTSDWSKIQAAAVRVAQRSGLSPQDVAKAIDENAAAVAEQIELETYAVETERYNGGWDEPEDRTAGIGGGFVGGGGYYREPVDDGSEMVADIQNWQARNGWTR
jgi:hypothetical protein